MTVEDAGGGFRAEVLALMRRARSGALATLLADGGPCLSLVNLAPADNGEAILLLSQLAWHTRNIAVSIASLSPGPTIWVQLLEGGS